jgi:hypothetical protein
LHWTAIKSRLLNFRRKADVLRGRMPAQPVLLVDLDGTVADWRLGLINWLSLSGLIHQPVDPMTNLMIDVDMGWPFSQYSQWLGRFEREGGYGMLPAFPDAVNFLTSHADHILIGVTSRPIKVNRILYDSLTWADKLGIRFDLLELLGEGRVAWALEMQQAGCQVLLLDDDPNNALRAAENGIRVVTRSFPYNEHLDHPNILRTDDFRTIPEEWTA